MIHFDNRRWARLKADSDMWWNHELERPFISVTLDGYESDVDVPELSEQKYASFYDIDVPAEAIVDVWDYTLSKQRFFGDAFPSIWPNFGAGVIAAFLGSRLENGQDTVWFHEIAAASLKNIKFEYDPDNLWLNRIKSVMKAAADRWNGDVLIGNTDLGGNLDIVASIRGNMNLLMDLYDSPEDVKKLTWQAHDLWWQYYDELNVVMEGRNAGYSYWCNMYSTKPYAMQQCDFAYMIGTKFFDEFVKPEIKATSDKMPHSFYHLDGVGQLAHLDSLLEIKSLNGVQWVPGAGQPAVTNWPEVYKKISDAGKCIQFSINQASGLGFEAVDIIIDQIGTTKGIYCIFVGNRSMEEDALKCLEKYKII
jgi:hypothetical protein